MYVPARARLFLSFSRFLSLSSPSSGTLDQVHVQVEVSAHPFTGEQLNEPASLCLSLSSS